jgi:aspartyl-tRNA(Asn)/glutamyl-tRNA(Gln) amidotransferase subunit A
MNGTRKKNNGLISDEFVPPTISEAGKLLRNGVMTAVGLTETCINSIKSSQPLLNAFITITEEQALKTAEMLDRELAVGRDWGALHGIPIVHKDIYDTSDILTTVGSRFFRNRVPKRDAEVVRLLQEAGAILLGKTNMDEFAAGVSGKNSFFGDTHNPWDLERSPGGSSSGTAAAVAAGLCLGGTGTDTGGSIRIPASWTGLVGIRPTYGRISHTGICSRAKSLDSPGLLGRSVKDVALLLNAMIDHDPQDPLYEDFESSLSKGIRGLRLGVIKNYTFRNIDREVFRSLNAAVETLSDLGAEIIEVTIPVLDESFDYRSLYNIILYEFNLHLGEVYRNTDDKTQFGERVRANLAEGMNITIKAYEKALANRPHQVTQIKQAFEKADALLTPTMPTVAPLLKADVSIYNRGRQFTLPFNFAGLPSISVPCGLNQSGLPMGLQIIGDHLTEALILRIAYGFEAATGFKGFRPPFLYGSA